MTSEITNRKANGNSGMNEIRVLSADELDAVSGGVMKLAFNFKVAGMQISGGFDSTNGDYRTVVRYGDNAIVQGGMTV